MSQMEGKAIGCSCQENKHRMRNCVLMYILIVAYIMIGGVLFCAVEGDAETDIQTILLAKREYLVRFLLNSSVTAESNETIIHAMKALQDYEDELHKHFHSQIGSNQQNRWNFLNACFFCLTILSTIGYGNMTPVTAKGRLLCIIYAVIGIPMFIVYIARFGHSLSNLIHKCQKKLNCQCPYRSMLLMRRHIGNGSTGGKKWSDESQIGGDQGEACVSTTHDEESAFEIQAVASTTVAEGALQKTRTCDLNGISKKNISCVNNTLQPHMIEKFAENDSRPVTKENNTIAFECTNVDSQHDELWRPPKLCIVIFLVLYILIGSCIAYAVQDDWSLLDSVYFCVVTFTTIGFGDLAPSFVGQRHQRLIHQVFLSWYIVIGLVIMSTVVNLLQRKLVQFAQNLNHKTCHTCQKRLQG
ncbi:potassium channel subfamily K member 18-like [Glandiceps talaboti]